MYCGANDNVKKSFRQIAVMTGQEFANNNLRLVYGGAQVGLMGLLADSVLANNGQVIGVIPDFLSDLEITHTGVTELIRTKSMHERKVTMAERADAFVVLPGGLGTLEETFEILTWKQLGLHNKPIIILNTEGFWDHLIVLIEHLVNENFAREENLTLFTVVNTVDEILNVLNVANETA